MAILYLLITGVALMYNFCIRGEKSYTIQKLLILVPLLKAFESTINMNYFQQCPWEQNDMRGSRKLNAISLYTFVNILMIFLSRGWFTRTYSITTCKIIKYGFAMFILDWF